jgi:hypothetical protein
MSSAVLSVSQEDILLLAPHQMKARPAAEAEKLIIDKNDIIGNSVVDLSRQIICVNSLRA